MIILLGRAWDCGDWRRRGCTAAGAAEARRLPEGPDTLPLPTRCFRGAVVCRKGAAATGCGGFCGLSRRAPPLLLSPPPLRKCIGIAALLPLEVGALVFGTVAELPGRETRDRDAGVLMLTMALPALALPGLRTPTPEGQAAGLVEPLTPLSDLAPLALLPPALLLPAPPAGGVRANIAVEA